MPVFWSKSKQGFYDDAIHGARQIEVVDEEKLEQLLAETLHDGEESDAAMQLALAHANPPMIRVDNPECLIPDDAIEISAEEHAALMSELSNGKILSVGSGGKPAAVDPVRSVEDQLAAIRRRRTRELAKSDWTQAPDALTAAKRKAWAQHRQLLRDLPALVEKALAEGKGFDSVEWPEAPA